MAVFLFGFPPPRTPQPPQPVDNILHGTKWIVRPGGGMQVPYFIKHGTLCDVERHTPHTGGHTSAAPEREIRDGGSDTIRRAELTMPCAPVPPEPPGKCCTLHNLSWQAPQTELQPNTSPCRENGSLSQPRLSPWTVYTWGPPSRRTVGSSLQGVLRRPLLQKTLGGGGREVSVDSENVR